jgi:hypothetical protein
MMKKPFPPKQSWSLSGWFQSRQHRLAGGFIGIKEVVLYSHLKEEVCMNQPQDFQIASKKHLTIRLVMALYRVKQNSRDWNIKIDNTTT